MVITGKYKIDILSTTQCKIKIENGMLYVYPVNDFTQPKDRKAFDIKITEQYTNNLFTQKYFIEYFDINQNVINIFIQPNKLELFKIKWNLKKYDIQQKEMKMHLYKYLFGLIIGIILTVLTQFILYKLGI